MNEDLVKAQDVFLQKINKICRDFGLNNIMAQLYAILYFSKGPLSLNDMLERLKISKGSVSINIRALERYGAVRRIWVKGSRKDYYESEADISKVIMDRVKSMVSRRLSEVNEMMDASYRTLDSINSSNKDDKESVRIFKERLDNLKSLQNKAQSLFNMLNSGIVSNVLKVATKPSSKKEALIA